MKRILFFFVAILICQFTNAQKVGIGTTSPATSAMLDLTSTTGGLLVPRMTGAQRRAIVSPISGLIVYQTLTELLPTFSGPGFYIFSSGQWKSILDSDDKFWSKSSSRNWVYNTSDSIGIGTNAPTEWLDVNGNIRARQNIKADAVVQGNALVSSGTLTTVGTSLLNGEVTANSDLIINNTTATLQFKSNNINKGFFQLSGDNVRMGTNSGNTTGNLILRMNGNDRVQINPAGDIDLDGKITRTAITGTANLLPLCMGLVNSDGTIFSGTGNFTVTKTGIGDYTITCTGINSSSIFFSSVPYQTATSSTFYGSANNMAIRTWIASTGIREDHGFYFIVYKL